jgi:hypothetical protein
VHSTALCSKGFHTAQPAVAQRSLQILQAKSPEEEAEDDRWAKNPYGWTTGPIARRNGLVVQVCGLLLKCEACVLCSGVRRFACAL